MAASADMTSAAFPPRLCHRRVLWVDDEVQDDDPLAALLALQGLHLDVAPTIREALEKLQRNSYSAVLLDLRLGDGTGLTVLETLRYVSPRTAVLVLTGYGDVESAVHAMRLGAVDFLEKPIDGDYLASIIRRRLLAGWQPLRPSANVGELRAILAQLFECRVANAPETVVMDGDAQISWQPHDLLRLVGTRLLDVEVDAYLFIALAASFRTLASPPQRMSITAGLSSGLRALTGLRIPTQSLTHKVIAEMIGAQAVGRRIKQFEVAAQLGVDAAHLGRVIRKDSGLRFDEWRTAVVMHNAARLLMLSDTMVSQLAYRLGYQHASQFVREFQAVFGLSPRQFRLRLAS